MENLNFQWGIWLSSLLSLSSIICYVLRLCNKVLLLAPICHLCDSHSLPSPLTTVPLGCSGLHTARAQPPCTGIELGENLALSCIKVPRFCRALNFNLYGFYPEAFPVLSIPSHPLTQVDLGHVDS